MSFTLGFIFLDSQIKHFSVSLTLSQTTNFRLFQTERNGKRQFQILITIAERSPNGYKTLWEKEKLLVTSNFSFSHGVFKRLVLQTRKNQGLFGSIEDVYVADQKPPGHNIISLFCLY